MIPLEGSRNFDIEMIDYELNQKNVLKMFPKNKVRLIFMNYFFLKFKNYKKYVINSQFKIELFLKNENKLKSKFLKEFLKTQIFESFNYYYLLNVKSSLKFWNNFTSTIHNNKYMNMILNDEEEFNKTVFIYEGEDNDDVQNFDENKKIIYFEYETFPKLDHELLKNISLKVVPDLCNEEYKFDKNWDILIKSINNILKLDEISKKNLSVKINNLFHKKEMNGESNGKINFFNYDKLPSKVIISYSLTVNNCKICKYSLTESDIKKGWVINDFEYSTICPKCGYKFIPRILVNLPNDVVLNLEFLSCKNLKKEILNLNNLFPGLEPNLKFINNHPLLFWNLVFHFRSLDIPLKFLFPLLEWDDESEFHWTLVNFF
jgi:hypothetical protein